MTDTFTLPEDYEAEPIDIGFMGQVGPIYQTKPDVLPARRAFLVDERHLNGRGVCHGGMLMSFADMSFGHAITAHAHRYWATVRLMTDFLAPGELGEWIEGSGEVVSVEDSFYVVRGRIWAGERVLMTGSGVFKALGSRPVRHE